MNRAIFVLLLLVIAALSAGCDSKPAATSAPVSSSPPVTVARPLQKIITEWDEYTGRFTAVASVEVRPRVSGFLDTIRFKDGQLVTQGDVLFVIDPRPYQLAVEQAKADVESARAKLEIATLDVERARPLLQSQAVTTRESKHAGRHSAMRRRW